MAGIINRNVNPTDDEEAEQAGAPDAAEAQDPAAEEAQGSDEAQEPGEAPTQSGQAPTQGDDEGPGEGEQDDQNVAQVVTAAMAILYKAGALKGVLAQIKSSGNVAEGLAGAVYSVMQVLDQKSNGNIPPEALVPAAIEILGMIAEDYEKASGTTVSGRDIAVATQTMLARFLKEAGVNTGDSFEKVDYDKIGAQIDKARAQMGSQQ